MIRRLLQMVRRPRERRDVLVEPKVSLHRCTLLGPVRVGYRSYANESLIRNAVIGRYCSIGRRCSVGAALHDIGAFSTHSKAAARDFQRDPQTIIGNDVWIGDNALVLAGVNVGDGAVIAGGAVVTKDVAPYAIVAGIPAREQRLRFDEAVVSRLLEVNWWRYGDQAIELTGRGEGPERLIEVLGKGRREQFTPGFSAWSEP